MDCDAEKPPSLPPNTSGSVAPAGPVITAGSKKVRDAVPPGCPFRSNWPLFAGSVRDTTLATPGNTVPKLSGRTPVTLVCPARGRVTTQTSDRIVKGARMGCWSGAACDGAGRGSNPHPCRRLTIRPPELERLVRHRHLHGADVGARHLAYRRGHRRPDEHEQSPSPAERGGRGPCGGREARAGRIVETIPATDPARDREVVRPEGEVRRNHERHAHWSAGLTGDVEAAGAGTTKRDGLRDARKDGAERQIRARQDHDRLLHRGRHVDAGVILSLRSHGGSCQQRKRNDRNLHRGIHLSLPTPMEAESALSRHLREAPPVALPPHHRKARPMPDPIIIGKLSNFRTERLLVQSPM